MHLSNEPVAALRGVVKRYGVLTAVDGLDLQVHRGELLALLGPNGAGKSTSVALLLGLIRPDSDCELSGRDPQGAEARWRIGVVPFCVLGMWIGTLIKGAGAPGLLNLVYLPMSFLSGLWVLLPMLPETLRRTAPCWPADHLDALARHALGLSSAPVSEHVGALAIFAAVFMGLAVRRLRRHG